MGLLSSCNSAKWDWSRAERENSLAAYERFIKGHPASEFAKEAAKRVETIRWQQAKETNTVEAYRQYVAQFPESTTLNDALARLATLEWEHTKRDGTLEAYADFISQNPTSSFAETAKRRIHGFKWEKLGTHAYRITDGMEYRWDEHIQDTSVEIESVDGANLIQPGGVGMIPTWLTEGGLQGKNAKKAAAKARGDLYFEPLFDPAGMTWVFKKAGLRFPVLCFDKGKVVGWMWFSAATAGATLKFGTKAEGITAKGFEIQVEDKDFP